MQKTDAKNTCPFIEIERGIYAMMCDYEYYFVINLQKKLKSKIIGKIYVVVTDDILTINIDHNGEYVRIKFDNFAEAILNGWTTDYAVYETMKYYQKEIMSRYFYQD